MAEEKELTLEKKNMPVELKEMMERQGYHFVGRHSATKACGYTVSSIKKNGQTCYKHQFYGIESWRCIQSSPAMGCNLSCSFCWRIIPEEVGIKWNELNTGGWDEPEQIVDGLVEEHRRIVSGYKSHKDVDMERWNESRDPAHVALSLTGEPLFYPKMNELLEAFHRRKISTFLVTNGTMAHALKQLKTMPTQLYVSVQAPNETVYEIVVRAKTLGAWRNFMQFLDVFKGMETRRVFRLTLLRGINMVDAKGYASLIVRGDPHYVEVKGFTYVGGARGEERHMSYEHVPHKEEILAFAEELAKESGYALVDYHEHSRVALLCRDAAAAESRLLHFEK